MNDPEPDYTPEDRETATRRPGSSLRRQQRDAQEERTRERPNVTWTPVESPWWNALEN